MTFKLAVVHSTPTPAPAPAPGCVIQEQVGYGPAVFRCYTQEQWDLKQAQRAQQAAVEAQQANAAMEAFVYWHGWPYVGVIALALVIWRIVYVIRHPKDRWGIRR